MWASFLFVALLLIQYSFAWRAFWKPRPIHHVSKGSTLDGTPTKLLAHRGESVLLPPHTLPAYEMAIIEGADFVEPDLHLTKDNVLVCHHNMDLLKDTDVSVHTELAHLKSNITGIITNDFYNITNDWFIKDFTAAELKTLKVIQYPVGIRPQHFNSMFQLSTFEEFLDLVHRMSVKLNKRIGIIPELKHVSFYNSLENRPPHFMEDKFLEVLTNFGYQTRVNGNSPGCLGIASDIGSTTVKKIECPEVRIQSFEEDPLNYLSTRLPKSRNLYGFVLLIDNQVQYLTPLYLKDLVRKGVISELSLWKEFLHVGIETEVRNLNITYNSSEVRRFGGFIDPPAKLVNLAHKYGIGVSVYTIKDSYEMKCGLINCLKEKEVELNYYFGLGIDGIFVENVGEALNIREKYETCLKT